MSTANSNIPLATNVARVIAERIGVTDQTLSDMLNGRKVMRPECVTRLTSALGVDANELYRE